MKENYDSSWDLAGNEEADDNKFSEWQERSREREGWIQDNLKYPFVVKRMITIGELESMQYGLQIGDGFD